MKISWRSRGYKSFFKILEFVQKTYGEKAAENFGRDTRDCIRRIREQPYLYPQYKTKAVRSGLVNRFVTMFYKVKPRKEEIEILYFHENRQNPNKKL